MKTEDELLRRISEHVSKRNLELLYVCGSFNCGSPDYEQAYGAIAELNLLLREINKEDR